MRMTLSVRKWLGNTALFLILSLVFTVAGNGLAMAQSTGTLSNPSASVQQALTQAGQTSATTTISFEGTTPSFTGVWVDVFGPNGHDRSGGPQQVQVQHSVATGVYSVIYTVYLNVLTTLSSIPTVVYGAYNTVGGVLYDVYLHVSTPPPNSTTTSTGVSSSPTPSAPFVQSVYGTEETQQITVNGRVVSAVLVTVNAASLAQGLAAMAPSQQTLTITVSVSAIPTGGYIKVTLPPTALTEVAAAGKSLGLQTPEGDIVLPPGILNQIAAAVPAGDHVSVLLHPASLSTLQAIQSEVPASETSTLKSGGAVEEISFNVSGGSGTATKFEPTHGATAALTLPYNSTAITGQDALKLGVYRFDSTTKTWVYVGGKVDLTTGQIMAAIGHLSTYGVFEDTQTFPDIQGFWAQSDIELMVAHHVLNGVSPTSFEPNADVTRAQFATMIARALNLNTSNPNAPFSDVSPTAYYAGAVAAANRAGIILGYPNGTFGPNANITREEMAAMIVRAMAAADQPSTITAQQLQKVLAPYRDRGTVESWAIQDMAIAIQQGIIKGMTSTTLVPAAPATRAQAAVMVKRLLGYLGDL